MAAPPDHRRSSSHPADPGVAPAADGPGAGDRPGALHLAGVDVGGTKLQVVVTDADFTVRGESRAPTPQSGGPPAVAAAICELVAEALTRAGAPRLGAVGVGAPGTVDRATGIVARSPNLAGWFDPFPLGPELSGQLGVPVVVDNDVRIGMLGEHRLGAAKGYADALGVWFGTGVGGALILGGDLRLGRIGSCGEIGHVCVWPGGRRCGCGRRGCLEAYAGRASMERRATKLVEKGHRTELFTLMAKRHREHLTSSVIADSLEQGDRLAHALIADAVEAAGAAIASVCNVVDVEVVIIGGGLGSRLGQPFAELIAGAMQPHLFVDGADSVRVLTGGLGDLAGSLGAASEAAAVLATAGRPRSRAAATSVARS